MNRVVAQAFLIFGLLTLLPEGTLQSRAAAQSIESPDRKIIFRQDSDAAQKLRKKEQKKTIAAAQPATNDLDVKAPSVQYNKETKEITATGGVLISQGGFRSQSDSAVVNTETKDSKLKGDVVVSTGGGDITAQESQINLETETGDFADAEFFIDEGGFSVEADRAEKVSERKFNLFDAAFSGCQCEDGTKPWTITTEESHITQEGYAHCYNTSMDFHGVPVFYTPYFAFPVKNERQSGLLVPLFGYSNRDGAQFKIPAFIVLDDSTDMTLTPFIETRSRVGSSLDFRETFSLRNRLNSRFTYSDESRRVGSSRGTIVDNLFDSSVDRNRFGGFLEHQWTSEASSAIPFSFVNDWHYVSDNLYLREMEDPQIGNPQDRNITSRSLFSTTLSDFGSAEVAGEYNRTLDGDQEVNVFQRAPQTQLNFGRSFRPFGYNPYGLKLVTKATGSSVNFMREEGFDGWRNNLTPSAGIPFHISNYVAGGFEASLNRTFYEMDEDRLPRSRPGPDADFPAYGVDAARVTATDRTVPIFRYSMSSAVERVFDLEPGNSLTYLTQLGSENQDTRLSRLKHTIEPRIGYMYIPDVSQDQLPQYDEFDRIRQRSLFSYGVKTSLFGRFDPVRARTDEITELTPQTRDLPTINSGGVLPGLGDSEEFGGFGDLSLAKADIREMATLYIRQTYDYFEDTEDADPTREAFSDISTDLNFYPSRSFGFGFGSNFNAEERDFSSWTTSTAFRDDRGDALKLRYTYQEEVLSYIEGNIQGVLSDRLELGYYARFDDRESEFLENRVALRFKSACNCWHVDFGYADQINPDKQSVIMTFGFTGLGDLAQNFNFAQPQNQPTSP